MVRGEHPTSEFVGLMLPKEVEVCVRLQSLLQGVKKSATIRKIIIKNLDDNGLTVAVLTERYATHLYTQWDLRYKDDSPFEQYIQDQKKYLLDVAKLPSELVDSIILECREQKNLHLASKSK